MDLYNPAYLEHPEDAPWTTQDGRELTLGEMTLDHRRNLLAYLERHAALYKYRYELQMATRPLPTAEMARDSVEDALTELLEKDALEWLRETPLYRCLASITSDPEPA